MKKTLFILMALFVLVGCQKQETQQQPEMDQRKDVSHKLIMKSLNDLQNKDLSATIMDLETSIKINPSEPEAYLLLGQILLKVKEYDHAAEFLDIAAKVFPDDGTIFYMLSIADNMSGKKLPAVLAARHSFEVFQAQQDKDNMLKSAALLHELIDTAQDNAVSTQKQDAAQPPMKAQPKK
jgi:outer membrane protein assembly factor BamD (BamD/ComL family)